MQRMRMTRLLPFTQTISMLLVATAASGQEAALEAYFLGREVRVELDMPATKDGIDIYPEAGRMDNDSYVDRLKEHGVAIASGSVATITKVRVKGHHIEVQLGGGGYGTLFDESADVSAPSVPKTAREKELEERLPNVSDASERHEIEEQLDDLAHERAREQAWLRLEAERLEEMKRVRIADKALSAGSRFNVRFDGGVPAAAITPAGLERALRSYVVFLDDSPAIPTGRSDFDLPRKGMLIDDVVDLRGEPLRVVERTEGNLEVSVMTFGGERPGERVEALFVEGVLVRFARLY